MAGGISYLTLANLKKKKKAKEGLRLVSSWIGNYQEIPGCKIDWEVFKKMQEGSGKLFPYCCQANYMDK